MVGLAAELKNILNRGNIKSFGKILHEGWLLKKELADNISNPVLDKYYDKALKVGAIGGKVLGAGGGGFFLFYCEPKYQNDLRKALNLRELKFQFESEGAKLVYFDQ